MKSIIIPERYNYIAAFLTLACNYKCKYCINYFGETKFISKNISGKEWVKGLNRIVSRDDLPITLQGGEPSLHRDFIYIINNIEEKLHIDILTNLQFDGEEFIRQVNPERLKRNAPYPSIRVSYHPDVMDFKETVDKVLKMQEAGFSIGLFGVLHPTQEKEIKRAQKECLSLGIDFRTKEFLGEYNDRLYGTYRFPEACDRKSHEKVRCRTTELIIGRDASIYRCHSDLYEGRNPIGNLLDDNFNIEDKFRDCEMFGYCNPCDIKTKTNRFQVFGHTSVEIEKIDEVE